MTPEALREAARRHESTEVWPAGLLHELQTRLSARLLDHAASRVPHYRDQPLFAQLPVPGTRGWRQLPLLTRAQVQKKCAALRDPGWMPGWGAIYKVSTSGSTGEPVIVWRTAACNDTWEINALREHRWHGRDATRSLAIIRVTAGETGSPEGRCVVRGRPFDQLWSCGPTYQMDMTTDVSMQADWLRRILPDYLLTYPANLEALLDEFAKHGCPPIRQVLCVGGAVTSALRRRCQEVLRCAVRANYSSQEVGIMAVDCVHCGQYHVMSESVILELLDADGQPARRGEVGRVVVTDLHNLAMPLIRYEIGDYARAGEPCPGGITLPTIREFVGRQRNMLVHADGRRHWPVTGFSQFRAVAPVLRYQLIQHSLEDIELRVAVDNPLVQDQKSALARIVAEALNGDFRVWVSEFPGALPKAGSGKFEEFVSHVA